MENIIMHLITIVTLIVMVFVIIGIPYLMGIAIDRIFNSTTPDRDPIATWMIGAIGLVAIGLFGAMIYVIYTDIFTYYTKP
jgi:ABC-type multidrug transport system fused ATPase/permease subunit